MQTIGIEFCHPVRRYEVFPLSWTLLNHEAAFVWYKLFCQCLTSDHKYFTRFTGFVGGEKDLSYLMKSLNKCIDIINNDGRYFISERASEFSQNFSNAIHHHFEILSGSFETSSSFAKTSTPEVAEAINGLNYLIHDMEAYCRNIKSPKHSFAGVITEVRGCSRFKMPHSFDRLFTMNVMPGDLVAHYSQIGKSWQEAFFDKDEDIFPDAIRPLYALSGEFDIMFGKVCVDKKLKSKMADFLIKKGQKPDDPSLRLGYLPLATINNAHSLTNREFKETLSYYCDIKSIRAYTNLQVAAERIFSN